MGSISRADLLQLAKALGLPPKTRSFVLSAGVDRITTLKVEYIPDAIDIDALPIVARETWTVETEKPPE